MIGEQSLVNARGLAGGDPGQAEREAHEDEAPFARGGGDQGGGAFTFDGVHNHLRMRLTKPPSESFSLELVFRADESDTDQAMVAFLDKPYPKDKYHYIPVGIYDGKIIAGLWDTGDVIGDKIVPGRWYHFLLVYDHMAKLQAVYLNGRLQGVLEGEPILPGKLHVYLGFPTKPCTFTRRSQLCRTPLASFKGRMADFRIYDKAISPDTLAAHFALQGVKDATKPAFVAAELHGTSRTTAELRIAFSEAIHPDSVTDQSVRILQDAAPVAGKLVVSGNSVLFRPAAPFQEGKRYQVLVGPELADLAGNRMGVLATKTFTANLLARRWIVSAGFRLVEDTSGFEGPVGIAFLNRPGKAPDDPLYLVTEIRGTIRVVTRAREVKEFGNMADAYKATAVLPAAEGAYGLQGICFSPDDRYLFTTSVYRHEGVLKNRLTRWESEGTPRWGRGRPSGDLSLPFQNGQVGGGHSAGNCHVDRSGKLWVGMGDGGLVADSHNPDRAVGKLYRINQDFTAPKDNPFYDASRPKATRSYVFSTGLRNPWAIALTPWNQVFIADNGPQVDRLVGAKPGYDFPWSGTNTSMTYNAELVWPLAIGPASMLYVGKDKLFPTLRDNFVISSAALTRVIAVPYQNGYGVSGDPTVIFRGPKPNYKEEALTGVARGPDGIYVAHMLFDKQHFFLPTSILRVEPARPGEQAAGGGEVDGGALFAEMGCQGCHKLGGKGGETGPSLDGLAGRLKQRLSDAAYRRRLEGLAEAAGKKSPVAGKALARLLEGKMDARIRAWVQMKLANPKFEKPDAQMPLLPLDEAQRTALAKHVLAGKR